MKVSVFMTAFVFIIYDFSDLLKTQAKIQPATNEYMATSTTPITDPCKVTRLPTLTAFGIWNNEAINFVEKSGNNATKTEHAA
ncbi:MAG: hypothetical protein CO141_02315 [Candidatus Moranbacteria bacterium CG_4_9_14_3_um_filter_42_9]|nr:MAG: hypothetical protein CO141_02315 [Candidatus Moranbacteria bacterium CG_4_9_14_3_um_filter_42_9]